MREHPFKMGCDLEENNLCSRVTPLRREGKNIQICSPENEFIQVKASLASTLWFVKKVLTSI